MSWILFTIAAALLWSGANLIDKHILTDELRDPVFATIISGASAFVLFTILSFLFGSFALPFYAVMLSIIAGITYAVGIMIYFFVIQREEVSRVAPLFSTIPIFVLFFAFFIGEQITRAQLAGVFLIVLGAMLVSARNIKHHFRLSPALFWGLGSALFLAIRNVLTKMAAVQGSIWSIMFWVGVGSGLTALSLVLVHHPHIVKKAKQGVEHLLVSNVLASTAFVIFTLALALGPVSLTSALAETKPLFVFLAATFLSKTRPKFVRERITRADLLQKSVAIILVVVSAFLVT